MGATSNKKRILFVSSFTPPLNAGGSKNAFSFASFIAGKDYPVTLLSLNRKGKLKRRERAGKLKIARLLYFNDNFLTKLFSLLIILPGYFYYVLINDIIFLYGGNIIAFEFVIIIGRVLGKKVVFRSLMYGEDDPESLVNRYRLRHFYRRLLEKMSLYFSINPAFSASYKRVVGNNTKLFESVHGVNTDRFFPVLIKEKQNLRKKLGIDENLTVIISVGFLLKRKGYNNIFEALSLIDIPFVYYIVGDHKISDEHFLRPHKKEMAELFENACTILGDRVVFTGRMENVNEYLQASDIFILNSFREGFPPNSIMEAMACGLPTIVKDIEGVNGYFTVRNKNLLVSTGQVSDIRRLITEVIKNPAVGKEIGNSAADDIRQYASFEVIWEKLKARLGIIND